MHITRIENCQHGLNRRNRERNREQKKPTLDELQYFLSLDIFYVLVDDQNNNILKQTTKVDHYI